MRTYLFLLAFMSVLVTNSDACSCAGPLHPQTHFCDADFVMQVRLRPSGRGNKYHNDIEANDYRHWEKTNYQRFYNIKINRIFKLVDNEFGYNKNTTVAKLVTPATGSLCGVFLEENVKYVISGKFNGDGKLSIQMCDSWVMPWPHVTRRMRKNLRFSYMPNCNCSVVDPDMMYGDKEIPKDSCIWKYFRQDSDCYSRYSTCVIDINSSTGGCRWHRNRHLKKCRADLKNAVFEP